MKLLRFGERGAEKPGLLDDTGAIRDLSGVVDDINPASVSEAGLAKIAAVDPNSLPLVSGNPRLGPCVSGFQKFICIGLNYSDHAAETGADAPPEPIIFMKTLNALNGPKDDVIIPRGAEKTDWEIELAMIIGKQAHHVDEAEALDYVAGYAIANDVSERAFQTERAGQWTKGKSCDTFGPLGPWLVTRDEIADPQNLDMTLDVNGKRFQDGNTKTMIFNCAHLVAYLSTFMTLFPGDVISTGTPPGVGIGIKPAPVFLKAGDEMTLNIAGLGTQHSRCIAWSR